MPFITGEILQNRYRIVKLLAQGGFGTLYRAWDTALGRPCVLKENLAVSPDAQRQFLREAKILANLNHPNLPRVTDYFVDQAGGQYLVMDYVEGQDLQQMLEDRGGPFPEDRVVEWGLQICDALAYLHTQSPPVIHRDVKPANIRITPQNKAVLVDFGIAKVYDARMKTTLGAQAISPGYSPIEQYGKGRTDARSDIYALGATLFTLLTAQEPVESTQRVVKDPLVAPRMINQNLKLRTSAALIRAMQMDPTQRFQTMAEVKTALTPPPPIQVAAPAPSYHSSVQPVLAGQSGSKTQVGWLVLVGGLVVIILFLLSRLTMGASVSTKQADLTEGQTQAIAAISVVYTSTENVGLVSATTSPTTTLEPTLTPLVYIIQSGDTCSEIAEAYQVSIQEIVSQNEGLALDCDLLFSGQPLLIPQYHGPISTPNFIRSPSASLAVITQVSEMDGMTMVYVPAGRFTMGGDASEESTGEYEAPQHEVYLSAFWIDQTEVTNSMYALCVSQGFCQPPREKGSKTRETYYGDPSFEDFPVIYVGWEEAKSYCRWTGRRLPTEAEWEKAARGIDLRTFPWGEIPAGLRLANYGEFSGDTSPVGSYPAGSSPYGVMDLAGNAAEWVADWFDPGYYSISPYQNPAGPTTGEFRLIRGGSWFNQANSLRTTFRMWNYPDLHSDTVGFRCAK